MRRARAISSARAKIAVPLARRGHGAGERAGGGDNARGVRMRVVLYESEPRWEPPGRTILTDYGLA
jgi:hypothetical protein